MQESEEAEKRWRRALGIDGLIEPVTAALYTAPRGYRIERRSIDEHICNLILDESVVVFAGGRRRTLAAGGALWIAPGVEHSFSLPDPHRPFTMLNLRFRVSQRDHCLGFPAGVLLVDDAHDLRPLWEMVIDDAQQQRPDRCERLRHILAVLYGDLVRRNRQRAGAAGLGRRRRLALMSWVAKHHHLRPTTADLAAVVGLSEDWFRRAFRHSFGLSPRAWLVRERIQRAAHRLADDPTLAIAKLAEDLGYEDHRLLDRQFRAVLGTSPGRWRRS